MKELYIFCEGRTEQVFCNQVLAPQLFPQGDGCIHTILVAKSKHHGEVSRGGIVKYASLKRDIQNTTKSRRQGSIYFTTLIDLYGLPSEFPGKSTHVREPSNPKLYIEALEIAFGKDIAARRFIPHLQLHEFETMLFCGPEAFRVSFEDCEAVIVKLKDIAASFASVEHINDGTITAPSKRIIAELPAYGGRKSTAGPDIAEQIGLSTIRARCPHFDRWLTQLETLDWKEG